MSRSHRRREKPSILPTFLWSTLMIGVLCSGFFFVWLVLQPGPPALFLTVDALILPLYIVLAALDLLLTAFSAKSHRSGPSNPLAPPPSLSGAPRQPLQRWGLTLFLLAALGQLLGYAITLFAGKPLHPWVDLCYVSSYPLMILFFLLLPGQPLPKATRTRLLLDSLMVLLTMGMLSWYFLLGPIFLEGGPLTLDKIMLSIYPCFDLALFVCLVLIAPRVSDASLRPVMILFSLAILLLVCSDSIAEYLTIHATFVPGTLLDLGWPVAFLLFALAVQWMQTVSFTARHTAADEAIRQRYTVRVAFWYAILPYVLVPVFVGLSAYVLETEKNRGLALGVYGSCTLLFLLIFVRQLLAMREFSNVAHTAQQLNGELAAANLRLEALSTTDMLTGLPNHRALQRALEQESERAGRFGHPFSLLFFDGDRFKQVNDTHGHAVGDVVLRELGARAKSILRAGDTLGRDGGEEFLVVLPETNSQEARRAAERLRNAVAASPLAVGVVEGGIAITVSIGLASYPTDSMNANELQQRADSAMYWAKRLGRNQVRTAEEAILAERDATLKAATAHALERKELASQDGRTPNDLLRIEQLGLVYSLMGVLDVRDPGMSEHAHVVSDLVTGMARVLHFEQERLFRASTAAFLHDIGKIALPDQLLQKPRGQFSKQEWRLIHQHAELGADIVEASPWLSDLSPAIRHHHERWDGQGTPDGLQGEAIPLEARMIAVAEAYHAMISETPYQARKPALEVLLELQRRSGSQFDPALVSVLMEVLDSHSQGGDKARDSGLLRQV